MKSVSQHMREKRAAKAAADDAAIKEEGRLAGLAHQYSDSFVQDRDVLPNIEVATQSNVVTLTNIAARRRLHITVTGEESFKLRYEPPKEGVAPSLYPLTEEEMLEAVLAYSRDPWGA